ncbi:hypothetical protein [Rhizobium hainanense]|uniref:Uncharacterized protein n=1 Tax=Rhizobium hainanense TaxID=52131 RepID=A0A1C3WK10_9HYPH|nr:hypothetical protein [Rhizobium hainanense]SCB40186.1 hypothetical protein GA0061100_12310 [Rhizobium hainanense]
MSKDEKDPSRFCDMSGHDNDVTTDLVRLMPRDLVFQMRFLGESHYLLQRYFQKFMEVEMAAAGVSRETHPMIQSFIETHAVLMRDFVFSGVSLSHQFRLEEIELLIGQRAELMRVDIWDQLRSHIEMAEKQFRAQLPSLPVQLSGWEKPKSAPGPR